MITVRVSHSTQEYRFLQSLSFNHFQSMKLTKRLENSDYDIGYNKRTSDWDVYLAELEKLYYVIKTCV